MQHGFSMIPRKNRAPRRCSSSIAEEADASDGEEPFQSLREFSSSRKRKPLRRTRSLLVDIEDDTTSHEHTVVAPKVGLALEKRLGGYNAAALAALLLILLSSTVFYTQVSDWTTVDALYFTVVTLTTVGYGDVVPSDHAGRFFALILFFFGAGVVGSLLASAFSEMLDREAPRDGERSAFAKLCRTLCFVAAWTIGGACVMRFLEPPKYEFIDMVYWAGASLMTVGYGDITPKTNFGKVFAIFYLLGGTFLCLSALGSLAAIPIEARRLKAEEQVLGQYGDTLSQADFLELTRGDLVKRLGCIDNPETESNSLKQHYYDTKEPVSTKRHTTTKVSKSVFSLAMLVKLGKIGVDDVEGCLTQFKRLDHHQTGYLEFDDVDDTPPPAGTAKKRVPPVGRSTYAASRDASKLRRISLVSHDVV